MTDKELHEALVKRRADLGISYRDIQNRTGLGYNTVRRCFADPFESRSATLIAILRTMGCELVFCIANSIGDELEPEPPVEEFVKPD